MTVIILSKLDKDKYAIALQIASQKEGSIVVLLSDAVYLLKEESYKLRTKDAISKGLEIMVLKDDFVKRGFSVEGVSLIGLGDFVDLLMKGYSVINLN